MFNKFRTKQFNTVGELKQLLEEYPNNTSVNICGDDYCWFFAEEDKSIVYLDIEDLKDIE